MSVSTYRVLVTAVGGNVGQGVIKALRHSRHRFEIVGADMDPLSMGFAAVEASETVPRTGAPGFEGRFLSLLKRQKIRAVFVCGPTETEWFARHRDGLEQRSGARILVNAPRVLDISEDKWKTAEFLRENGFGFADSALQTDRTSVGRLIRRAGFPLFVKPRKSYASSACFAVRSRRELDAVLALRRDFVVQELVDDEGPEYTAGLHSDASGQVRASIILKRTLQRGTTYRTELVVNERFDRELRAIVEGLGSTGACNVQFRSKNGRVIPFEINARFSGTTGLRHLYGFNDAEMAFEEAVLGLAVRQPRLKPGVALRYWNEVWIPGASFASAAKNGFGKRNTRTL